jgi:NAD(P)-dependent dehydrogenase (short-subunit alcohol dehydrogenase family)
MSSAGGTYRTRTNSVNYGPVNTDRWDGLEKTFVKDGNIEQSEARKIVLGTLPLGRICEPEVVADVGGRRRVPRLSPGEAMSTGHTP